MTAPNPNNMPYQAFAQDHEGLNTFNQLYAAGIDDIRAIWRAIRWETGIDDDTTAALLAVAVYQVNAPEAAQIERLQAALRGSIGVHMLDLDDLYRDGNLLPGDLGEDA